MLSSVKPGKSRSRDGVVDRRCTLFLQDCVTVYSQDVVDAAGPQNSRGGGQILSARPGTAEHVRALPE